MTETYEEVPNAHTWRDPNGFWLFFLLCFIAMTALLIALTIVGLCVWAYYEGQLAFDFDDAAKFEQISGVLNEALLPMYGICAVALSLLTYRTVANAHAEGAENRLTGALLAAFIYFMPLVGLVMPPVVMRRLWHATFGSTRPDPGGLIATWWGATLLGSVTALASHTALVDSIDVQQRWEIVHALSLALRALACICLMLLFAAIVQHQRETRR